MLNPWYYVKPPTFKTSSDFFFLYNFFETGSKERFTQYFWFLFLLIWASLVAQMVKNPPAMQEMYGAPAACRAEPRCLQDHLHHLGTAAEPCARTPWTTCRGLDDFSYTGLVTGISVKMVTETQGPQLPGSAPPPLPEPRPSLTGLPAQSLQILGTR